MIGAVEPAFASTYLPHSVYLPDGRLLCWYHRTSDDHVDGFRLTENEDVGVQPIATVRGLGLLDELGLRHDGRPA